MSSAMNLLMWLIAPVIFVGPAVYQFLPDTYPAYLATKPKDSLVDSFYDYNRECVSYVAYKIYSRYHISTYGWGDAKTWLEDARLQHISVGTVPRVGAVGVLTGGQHGHAFYVENVYGDGLSLISQYNADGAGRYSVNELSAHRLPSNAYPLRYIYFN